MIDYSGEFEQLSEAYRESGGDPQALRDDKNGLMLISGNSLLGKNEIPGLMIDTEQLKDGVKAHVRVKKNTRIENPVHLCFGVIPDEGVQRIIADFDIEDNASAAFLAHCSFPNAVKVQHIMKGVVNIGENARMKYNETHFHGKEGGVEVLPKMKINVGKGGAYISTFKLTKGAAGKVDLDYEAYLDDDALSEMYAKIYGKSNDDIRVKESIYLNGKASKGLAESRIVVSGNARAEVLGEVIGNGADSRGHVDCMEIVQGKNARASAVPRLEVVDDTAKLTHEAAIGSVDKRQMQTLMARGLSEEKAMDTIVQGLLR